MVFFDLNVPYLEGESEKPLPENIARKNARLKIVVKVMELGYTGVAYNRSIKGVMSDSDRCTISLFPLSSLLKVAPTLSASVKLHRDLLGVPLTSPFRQYTRLTVSVDSLVQCAALNSGNPVLKTYNLVAVRPLNQAVFEQVCRVAEVDLITIDFSEKLPFRLKFPMVQAAIKRGIYFEITYSHLISDVQTRRQMVSYAKVLVETTRGKNLIFSSAATSASELRGPYDVVNLSSLLGLSMKHSKAAISKNCRSLLPSAIRKKQYYKEAIKVERISSTKSMDSKDAWFCDENSWDHISSGEGDLLLDDIANVFSASSKAPKAIDFASIADEMKSNGMQVKDWLTGGGGKVQPLNDTTYLSEAKELGVSAEVSIAGGMPLARTSLKHQTSGCQDFLKSVVLNNIPAVFRDGKEIATPSTCFEEYKSSDGAVSVTLQTISHGTPSQDWASHEKNHVLQDDTGALLNSTKNIQSSAGSKGSTNLDLVPSSMDHISTVEDNHVSPMDALKHTTPSKEFDPSSSYNEGSRSLNPLDMQADGNLDIEIVQPEEALINPGDIKQSKSGKARSRQRISLQAFQIPLKRLSSPINFKKKSWMLQSVDKDDVSYPNMEKRFIKLCLQEVNNGCRSRKKLKRYIELCLQEVNNGGRSRRKLKPSSWTRIKEEIKKEFGKTYSKKQVKKKWDDYLKTHLKAKQLEYANELASVDGGIVTGASNCGPHMGDLPTGTNALSIESEYITVRTPHSESLPSDGHVPSRKRHLKKLCKRDAEKRHKMDSTTGTQPELCADLRTLRKDKEKGSTVNDCIHSLHEMGTSSRTDTLRPEIGAILGTLTKDAEKGSTVDDCMRSLHEMGTPSKTDPLYFVAVTAFCEKKEYREAWMRMEKEPRMRWLEFMGPRLGLTT